MNFIDHSANSLAHVIRKNYPEAASHTLLFYALSLLINSSFSVFIVLTVSFFTGRITDSLLVIIFYTILRYCSGGIHFRSSLVCSLFSASVFLISSHLIYDYMYWGLLLNIASMIMVFLYAPSGIEKVSTIDEKYYPLLKIISVFMIAADIYFQKSTLSTAFFIQAFLTTRMAKNIVDSIEGR